MDSIYTYVVSSGRPITPHNAFLYIGLAAGIIPMICFLGYLVRAGAGISYIMRKAYVGDATLLPALVVFAMLESMILDAAFMSPWAVVVFGLTASSRHLYGRRDT